jgi:hypothetical protein
MKFYHILLILIPLGIGCSSSDNSPKPEIKAPLSVGARDIANFSNGRDLQVLFRKPSSLENIQHFRIYIVPGALAGTFDSLTALLATEYLEVPLSLPTDDIRFTENQRDTEGNLITEDTPYVIFVLSKATVESQLGGILSLPSSTITLQQKNVVRTLTQSLAGGTGGMDVDTEGNIYMADFGRTTGGDPVGTRVYKITPEGNASIFASGLVGASGNDFDAG